MKGKMRHPFLLLVFLFLLSTSEQPPPHWSFSSQVFFIFSSFLSPVKFQSENRHLPGREIGQNISVPYALLPQSLNIINYRHLHLSAGLSIWVLLNGKTVSQSKSCYFLPQKGVMAGEVARDMRVPTCGAASWERSHLPCGGELGVAERTSWNLEGILSQMPCFLYRWIPTCAQLFVSRKEQWIHFAPKSDYDSSRNIEEYFASVASFMSLQLRELVINSLKDLVSFFMIHKVCRGSAVDSLE